MLILDVREREEYEAEHIPGSILCPMSQLDILAPGILKNINADEIVVMCRSGNRAKISIGEFRKLGFNLNFTTYEGGILKWKQEGKEVIGSGGVFPVMRQVQILASTLIFFGFALAQFINFNFVYLALFVGFGLAMAGWTGFCPAAKMLQMMPWNKNHQRPVTDNNCCN
jgi:rhodanese-related sulfurtransferase